MAKWIADADLDLISDRIALATEIAVCSGNPTTYYAATWPDLWNSAAAYIVGDLRRPPTQNGCIYECTVAGNSGGVEPGWGTVQDQTFTDGTVTWKTHLNYALINTSLSPTDFTKADGVPDGRQVTVAEKSGLLVHTSGAVAHTVLLKGADKSIVAKTTSVTTLVSDDDVVEGHSSIIYSFSITIRDPQ